MDSPYSHLLAKTRSLQPSFQRFAVISIFEKLRSSPSRLVSTSDPGRDAIASCLASASAAVVDQSVRELCRLVVGGRIDPPLALVELQSALDGCDPPLAPALVKGLGFVCRLAFRTNPSWGRVFDRPDLHPFAKILSCSKQVQAELIQQVLMFIVHNKSVGMDAVLGFLKPFILFSLLREPFLVDSSSFARDFVSSVASLCCSLPPAEAICIIKLLTGCLKYFSNSNEEEFKYLISSAELLVDSFVAVLKQVVGSQKFLRATQACGLEILETLLSLCTYLHKPRGGTTNVLELSKRLLVTQRGLGLDYLPEFSVFIVSISLILIQVEFECEQLSILKLLIFLIEWKTEKGNNISDELSKELLIVFPVINLLSSPSRSVKARAMYLIAALERLLLDLSIASRKEQILNIVFPSISKPDLIPFRLLYHLWVQDQFPLISFLDFINNEVGGVKGTFFEERRWTFQLREYLNIERRKFTSPSQSSEGMSLWLSSVASVLAMHPTIGISCIDSLATIAQNFGVASITCSTS